jgi:fatty acid-binding protein DegV
MLGTALSVKPLLHVRDGRIVPLEKVRTSSRALARLVALTVQAAGADPVDIGVQHLAAKDRADEVAERLREQLPSVRQLITAEVSATVGVHTGPGVVGVAVAPVLIAPTTRRRAPRPRAPEWPTAGPRDRVHPAA